MDLEQKHRIKIKATENLRIRNQSKAAVSHQLLLLQTILHRILRAAQRGRMVRRKTTVLRLHPEAEKILFEHFGVE